MAKVKILTRAIRRPHSSPGEGEVRKQITCKAIYDVLYVCNTNDSLSLTVSEENTYYMFRGQSVHPRSKIMAPNESPPMISYMSAIQMKSLSLTVFEKNAYFMFLGQSVHLRSKVIAPNESPSMISYMSAIQKSLSLTVFEKNAYFMF